MHTIAHILTYDTIGDMMCIRDETQAHTDPLLMSDLCALQVELLRCLYREDLMTEIFVEKPEITQQRAACKQMVSALERALQVLNEVRSMDE
jgi:hypothetical protein